MAKLIWLVVGSLLLMAVIGTLTAVAENETEESRSPHIFAGKIVIVITEHSNALENKQSSETLKDAEIRKLGNKFFIVGTAYTRSEASSDWRVGATVGVDWNIVKQFYAYTPDQYEKVDKLWTDQEGE